MIIELWKHLSKRRRKQFSLLLILMVVASILEVISIGAVVPFLGALTSPEKIYQHDLAQPLIQVLNITDPSQLLFPLTAIFVVAILSSSAVRIFLLYVSTRLSFSTGADLSIDIYRRTLHQDYSTHISRNSSEIINSIITKTTAVIHHTLVPIVAFISSVFIILGIVGVIFTINTTIALISFFTFSLLYSIVTFIVRKSLQKNSELVAVHSTKMVKSLQEGLGGIRDVLIEGTQEFFCKIYQSSDTEFRRASGENVFIGGSPRYLIEAIGMVLIAILAYSLTLQGGGFAAAIPVLGAFAVGAQKLLPALQQAYQSHSLIRGSKSSFIDVLELLNQPLPDDTNLDSVNLMPFKHEIVFKNVSFRYTPDSAWILKNVNLSFKRGDKIGLIGVTGSGKSTLIDILMGLLIQTSGEILIDGVAITQRNRRAWQAHISHVPQSIYLADSTIQENIAFGTDPGKIKEYKVTQAAEQAQISGTINNLRHKYLTPIGERGVQLSGGQRQRIGIARALYKDRDVFIFDEATSALDNQTEKNIMQEISKYKDNKTIFIIAHRITTLKQCDSILRINADYTIDQVNYSQIEVD
jgi:ABC-type multidrug transport system fused ATPase/permease subunit